MGSADESEVLVFDSEDFPEQPTNKTVHIHNASNIDKNFFITFPLFLFQFIAVGMKHFVDTSPDFYKFGCIL